MISTLQIQKRTSVYMGRLTVLIIFKQSGVPASFLRIIYHIGFFKNHMDNLRWVGGPKMVFCLQNFSKSWFHQGSLYQIRICKVLRHHGKLMGKMFPKKKKVTLAKGVKKMHLARQIRSKCFLRMKKKRKINWLKK